LRGRWGGGLLHALNGEDAFQLFLKTEPDLLLLDDVLPRLDGLEILERARQSESRVPIVIMTAVFDESAILQALLLGATGFYAPAVRASEPADQHPEAREPALSVGSRDEAAAFPHLEAISDIRDRE
jgi:CheY-like chemotaxis protein